MSADGLEYVLPDGVDVAAMREALASRLVLVAERGARAERAFYDTFDTRLRAAGLLLVHQHGRLALLDAGWVEQAGETWTRRPRRLLLSDLPAGRLCDLLEPIVDVRALLPVARTRSRVQALRALNGDEKTVVRLTLEEAAAIGGNGPVVLAPRLRLAPVRGYDKELAAVRRLLVGALRLAPAPEPLSDAAVRALGGAPGGTPALASGLRRDQRADSAATVLLAQLLGSIEQNLPGALADVDSEFLHDLRVAVRRTRSVQRQLKRVFPPEPLARARADFRWLQQVTGPSRDLDVHLLDLDRQARALPAEARDDLTPLRDILQARRRRERRRMVAALRSPRTRALLDEWGAVLEGLVEAPAEARPDASRTIAEVAGARIVAAHRRMIVAGSAIDDATPPEDLHALRKMGKELRYLLELFGGLYPAPEVKPMIRSLKSLQDVLGAFQDREIQVGLLRSLRDEVGALDGGPQALMAMGLLVDRLEREQHAARGRFGERFAAFAADSPRRRVRKAFT
jgi:CHAD domain-containing protein